MRARVMLRGRGAGGNCTATRCCQAQRKRPAGSLRRSSSSRALRSSRALPGQVWRSRASISSTSTGSCRSCWSCMPRRRRSSLQSSGMSSGRSRSGGRSRRICSRRMRRSSSMAWDGSWLDAASTSTSERRDRWLPIFWKSRLSRKRRSCFWVPRSRQWISSRKSAPWWLASASPWVAAECWRAWIPKSSALIRLVGIALTFTGRKGWSRSRRWATHRARSSLPVPVSPWSSTLRRPRRGEPAKSRTMASSSRRSR